MGVLVGYKLVDTNGATVQSWGGIWGQCPGMPDALFLPTGDHIYAPALNTAYGNYQLVDWVMDPPAPTATDVANERSRRLALGFSYTFPAVNGVADPRGTIQIGTSPSDMVGWDAVTTLANALVALGQGSTPAIQITPQTIAVTITPLEWQAILVAAAQIQQPLWQKSFALQAMSPIPADYTSDTYWT